MPHAPQAKPRTTITCPVTQPTDTCKLWDKRTELTRTTDPALQTTPPEEGRVSPVGVREAGPGGTQPGVAPSRPQPPLGKLLCLPGLQEHSEILQPSESPS